MTEASFLLLLLFVLTIGHLLTLKLCSNRIDHRTAPLFISLWTLLGLLAVSPFYGHLLPAGVEKLRAAPLMFTLVIAKGVILYVLFIISQKLMQHSLSSRHYVTPLTAGLIAVSNGFLLGEGLKPQQWFSSIGLCLLAAAFLWRGHFADMPRQAKMYYAQLVALGVLTGGLDYQLTVSANWYTLLVISNVVLLSVAIIRHGRDVALVKQALVHPAAIAAGAFYAVTELVRFYQLATINPVSVIVTVQSLTKPVILALSALIWKERTVKEQLVWGILAFALVLPMVWGG